MSTPLYPDVTVQLVGQDGNAFAIVGRVKSALRKAGYPEAAEDFSREAFSGDYADLLRASMKYVEVD